MGREVCRAVSREAGLDLVCAIDPAWTGRDIAEMVPGLESGLTVSGGTDSLVASGVEVMVDFTIAEAARKNVDFALCQGISCVVGTTGLSPDDLDNFDRLAREREVGCLFAPNFAIGAVLMMDFARRAGRFMMDCEIVELHHAGKLDSPSGTALATATLIGGEGEEAGDSVNGDARGMEVAGVHIHSVRLPGLVAHQEVIFGAPGQTLTIRHDSYDRTSFMPGVVLAVREVGAMKGLVMGLDKLMGLE